NLVYAATLPRKEIFKSLGIFLKNGKFSMFIDALLSVLKHLFLKKNMNQERQIFWMKHNKEIPKISIEYDLAFGILGLSTYFIVDLVTAQKKYHWIRSDIRVLNRNEQIDANYYKSIEGSLSVSNECSEIFIKTYPFMENKVKVLY